MTLPQPGVAGVNGAVMYGWESPTNTMAAAFSSIRYELEGDTINVEVEGQDGTTIKRIAMSSGTWSPEAKAYFDACTTPETDIREDSVMYLNLWSV